MAEVWAAVIAGLGGAIVAAIGAAGGWYLRRSRRTKTKAEAADILTTSAMRLVQKLEEQVGGLETDVGALQSSVADRDERITALEQQVQELEAELQQVKADQVQDRNKIRYLSGRNTYLTRGIKILGAQMETLGIQPEWQNSGEPMPRPEEM